MQTPTESPNPMLKLRVILPQHDLADGVIVAGWHDSDMHVGWLSDRDSPRVHRLAPSELVTRFQALLHAALTSKHGGSLLTASTLFGDVPSDCEVTPAGVAKRRVTDGLVIVNTSQPLPFGSWLEHAYRAMGEPDPFEVEVGSHPGSQVSAAFVLARLVERGLLPAPPLPVRGASETLEQRVLATMTRLDKKVTIAVFENSHARRWPEVRGRSLRDKSPLEVVFNDLARRGLLVAEVTSRSTLYALTVAGRAAVSASAA